MSQPWPYNITDEVRAVHYILERDCPYDYPASCPREDAVRRTLLAYKAWLEVQPAADAADQVHEATGHPLGTCIACQEFHLATDHSNPQVQS